MNPIGYVGFFHDPTGFGSAAIAHAQALHEADVPLTIRSVRLDGHGVAPSRPRVRIASHEGQPSTHVLHVPPQHLHAVARVGARNIGFVAWETERLPASFHGHVSVASELWAPSAFSAAPFASTGRPVHVVPHPLTAVRVARAPFPRVPDDVFLFVSIFEWSDRKNPVGLLRAFRCAFDRPDVGLLLKIGVRFGADPHAVLAAIAREWLPSIPNRSPPLWVVLEDLSESSIERLHARADAYVSLHHAEGFGLCLAQAMARGRPVVATGYSGNLEFMDQDTAFLVEHDLVPIEQHLAPYGYFERSMHWAAPRLDSAVAALRACAFEPSRRTKIAEAGFARVRAELAPSVVGERMRALLA